MARFTPNPRARLIQEIAAKTRLFTVSDLYMGTASQLLRTPNPSASVEWFTVADNAVVARTAAVADEVDDLAVSADSVIGRAGSGNLDNLTAGNNQLLGKVLSGNLGFLASPDPQAVLRRTTADIEWAAAVPDSVFGRIGGGSLDHSAAAARRVLARGSSGDLDWKSPAQFNATVMDLATTGTTFPTTNMYDGRQYYRTDHYTNYYYDSGLSGWLSSEQFTIHGGENADESGYFDIIPFNAPYGATTIGWRFPFAVKPLWMTARVPGSSTCTLVVRADGVDVSNASIAYSSESGVKAATFAGGTITALENVALAVTSGTAARGSSYIQVMAGFRRFET